MYHQLKSILLVTLQFVFIFILLKDFQLYSFTLLGALFVVISLCLMLWAIGAMQESKLRILPQPSVHATLVTKGPYRFIRHPMYTAILIGSVGLLISYFTWMRLAVFITLFIVLMVKLGWEEKLLLNKFVEYDYYMKTTWRLLPFIF